MFLRGGADSNHGLGYYGASKPFFSGFVPDGPVLYGYSGGGLGINQNGTKTVQLFWTPSQVGIGTTNPTPGFKLDVNGPLRCVGFTNASSARYKHDVTPLDAPLDRLLALRPVAFTWNDDMPEGVRGRRDIGLIAEEVAALFPELVAMSDGPEGKHAEGLDYTRIAVLAVHALKQQQAQIAGNQTQIDALKSDNADLRARLDRLERPVMESKP
jgi:hypothetical protein